jgi:hypothetical protein
MPKASCPSVAPTITAITGIINAESPIVPESIRCNNQWFK